MLKVKTRIAPSPIHGIGLFAGEPIPAGTVIWEYDPPFDLPFKREQLEPLPVPARQQVEKYSYFEKEIGAFVLCGDDSRFMNHSETPNTVEMPGPRTVAAQDIRVGEEITCNYAELGDDPGEFAEEGG